MSRAAWKRRKSGLVNLTHMDVDNAEARQVRKLILRNQFREAAELIDSATSTDGRAYLIEAAADWSGTMNRLFDWASTGSRAGTTVYAVHRLKHAWNLTPWTFGTVDIEAFASELSAVKAEFSKLASADHKDASFFYWFQWLARGMQDPKLAEDLYKESRRRDPSSIYNASSALASVSSSWFGSDEQVVARAIEVNQSATSASVPETLLIEAVWLNSMSSGGTVGHPAWGETSLASAISAAHSRVASINPDSYHVMRAHQWLAFGSWSSGELRAAQPHFEAIGNAFNEHPWGRLRFRLDRLLGTYYKAKKQCMKA